MKIIADEWKDKPLRDFLQILPPSAKVAIGSTSAFVYIGRADGFERDCKITYHNYIKKAERMLSRSTIDPVWREWAVRYLTESVPFMDRNIKRIYPRDNPIEPPIINVIIDGEEQGKYWLLCEYESPWEDNWDE